MKMSYLHQSIISLLNNKDEIYNMMKENNLYYKSFVKPDVLVLNALSKVIY